MLVNAVPYKAGGGESYPLTGLIARFDPTLGVTLQVDPTYILTWDDQSGNAHHLNAGYSPNYITSDAGINNSPCIEFVAINNTRMAFTLPSTMAPTAGAFTIFAVIKSSSTASNECFVSLGNVLNEYIGVRTISGNLMQGFGSGLTADSSSVAISTSSWYIVGFRASGTQTTMRVNGTQDTPEANVWSGFTPDAGGIGELYRSGSYGDPANGRIADILIYNTAISDADMASIEATLNGKYGIF